MIFFLPIIYELFLICFIYIKSSIQDLQIIKLPYLSINNNTENLYLGENMEKQTYIIDTGSTITTSPCIKCTKCGKHLNNYFSVDDNSDILCNDNKCKIVKSHCGSKNRCCFFYFLFRRLFT